MLYGVSCASASSVFFDTITKANVDSGAVLTWSEPDSFPGEPLFVPRPSTAPLLAAVSGAEDDGVLLSVVLEGADVESARSFLLVLDASSMKELGRASLDSVIPFGFHGRWYDE